MPWIVEFCTVMLLQLVPTAVPALVTLADRDVGPVPPVLPMHGRVGDGERPLQLLLVKKSPPPNAFVPARVVDDLVPAEHDVRRSCRRCRWRRRCRPSRPRAGRCSSTEHLVASSLLAPFPVAVLF